MNIWSIVHNYSSYVLSEDEELTLSYGLENRITTKISRIAINTEFEQFYHRLLHDISHIPEESLAHIKTKSLNTCEKYSKMRDPYKHRKIVETLLKNSRIVIMKQDKGWGVVLMDKTVFREMLGHIRYQPVYKVKYRPNKENWRKDPTSFTEN